LTLSNNWNDFGGINQYLQWVGGGLVHDDFYRDERVRSLFRNYIRQVLTRVNTLTGIAYKDDPTIMIWELMNEPRADDKPSFYAWIDEMAGYIKSLDSQHLVSTGSEGGFATDFVATHASPHIDVASMHLYPENWNISIEAATSMLRDHIIMAREQLKKPLYLGEFGLLDQTRRTDVYRQWYDVIDHEDGNGALLWILSGAQYDNSGNKGQRYPDYDGYTIYYPESTAVVPTIQDFSAKMRAKKRAASAKAVH
jgi:mannan endo-1,4-beta-mannosidase